MRDKKRIKRILKRIEKIWNKYPDLRFFQLIEAPYEPIAENPFYIEDEDFIDKMEEFYGKRN